MEEKVLSRKELYDLVWSQPMLTLAKTYNISDVGLRKICIKMSIPMPSAGHWQKLKFGKSIPQIPLPSNYSGQTEVTLELRTEENTSDPNLSPQRQAKLKKSEIENSQADLLVVPERLSSPDKLIIAARENLNRKDQYLHNGMVSTERGYLDIRVTRSNIPRALRFFDTLIKLLKFRKHEVIVEGDSTYAVIKEQRIKMSLREKTKMVKVVDTWERTEFQPTGALCFQIDGYYGREWVDKKQMLEDCLSSIIAKLESEGERQYEWHIHWENEREKQREKVRLQKEFEHRRSADLKMFTEMLFKSSRWHKSENLRSYIQEVENRAKITGSLTQELKDWIAWAKQKADWYDPFIEVEDELLKQVDRETLTVPKPNNYGYN